MLLQERQERFRIDRRKAPDDDSIGALIWSIVRIELKAALYQVRLDRVVFLGGSTEEFDAESGDFVHRFGLAGFHLVDEVGKVDIFDNQWWLLLVARETAFRWCYPSGRFAHTLNAKQNLMIDQIILLRK